MPLGPKSHLGYLGIDGRVILERRLRTYRHKVSIFGHTEPQFEVDLSYTRNLHASQKRSRVWVADLRRHCRDGDEVDCAVPVDVTDGP